MAVDPIVMRRLYWTSLVLVLVGAFNLGIMGLTGVNLLATLFGGEPWLLRAIYLVVGIAGVFLLYYAMRVDSPVRRTARTRTY